MTGMKDTNMKITKRQLKRIIKEEKARLMNETVADMKDYQDNLGRIATQISSNFGDDMMTLYDEDPGMFQGRSTRAEWDEQVVYAQQELDTGIVHAIERVIEEIETRLHDGQYHRG